MNMWRNQSAVLMPAWKFDMSELFHAVLPKDGEEFLGHYTTKCKYTTALPSIIEKGDRCPDAQKSKELYLRIWTTFPTRPNPQVEHTKGSII